MKQNVPSPQVPKLKLPITPSDRNLTRVNSIKSNSPGLSMSKKAFSPQRVKEVMPKIRPESLCLSLDKLKTASEFRAMPRLRQWP